MSKKFNRRTRRQWKKLVNNIQDAQSFWNFCDRFFGRTRFGDNYDDKDVAYASLYHGINQLFCIGLDTETGELVRISKVAPQAHWGRQQ